MNYETITGNLFKIPVSPNTILVHACNCRGSWGAGIANGFKVNFPVAYTDYQYLCKKHGDNLIGMGFYHKNPSSGEPAVGYLFTSRSYGENKDSMDEIIKNTSKAIKSFLAVTPLNAEIHSPRINAGLFGVPWDITEAIIKDCLKTRPDVKWVVWKN